LNGAVFVDLAAAFQRRFRVVHADSVELLDACYRLRHAVYCEEFGFEPLRKDGRETDEWDAQSVHCLVQSVSTGEYVGCARLVTPPCRRPRTPLPFERVCDGAIDRTIVDPHHLPRASMAEVSRLAVMPEFRRFGRKNAVQVVPQTAQERTTVPCVMAGLYVGLLALARAQGIETAFMLLEQRLARYLGTITGVRPQIIGQPVEHRGLRVPAMLRVSSVFDNLNSFFQPLFAAISSDIRVAVPRAA